MFPTTQNGELMKMSERNQLLIKFQEDIAERVEGWLTEMANDDDIYFTNEEIKGALQHVICTYTK